MMISKRVLLGFVIILSALCLAGCKEGEPETAAFLYISHRGGCDSIPENTGRALTHALDRGFDGVELDVWETESGELLVFHDATLERMCNREKYIWEISGENREQYPILPGKAADGEEPVLIPALEEVLDELKERQCPVYLHIKIDKDAEHYFSAEAAAHVVTLLKERDMVEQTIVFSTHQETVLSLFFNQGLHLGYITGQTEREVLDEKIDWCVENQVKTLILYKMDGIKLEENGAALVKACHEKGLSVGVYKVTKKEDEEFLIKTGADFSISKKAFFK